MYDAAQLREDGVDSESLRALPSVVGGAAGGADDDAYGQAGGQAGGQAAAEEVRLAASRLHFATLTEVRRSVPLHHFDTPTPPPAVPEWIDITGDRRGGRRRSPAVGP